MTREVIDLTPTWGEWGLIYRRLAESGETQALRPLRPDLAAAFAAASAFNAIRATLTDEQVAIATRVLTEELTKQGY